MGEIWGRLTEGQKKAIGWLALVMILGVGLLVLQPPVSQPAPSSVSAPVQVEEPSSVSVQKQLEMDLTAILNTLLGGSYAQVFITMDRGPQLKIAYNLTEEERYSSDQLVERRLSSTPVLLRNDVERKEVPLVLEQGEPLVRGVLVVVSQEDQVDLRLILAQAVATALQVPMYRIEVLFKQ